MKQTPEYLQARLETCRRLFFQYKGREHSRIEREMRANGFPDFNRRCLYPRGINSGWIEKYRWDRELQWSVNSDGNEVSTESGSDRGFSPGRSVQKPAGEQGRNTQVGGYALANARASATRRRAASSSPLNAFHAWIKKVSPPMFDWDAPHLKLLIKTLQLVTEGKIKRLMIFMPPRHGKSELVTTRYTAWRLLMEPALKVILASYNQHLANRFSRNIRNTLAEHFAFERRSEVTTKDHENAQKQFGRGVSTGSGSDRGRSSQDSQDSPDTQDSQPLSNPFRAGIINSAAEWETGFGGGVKAVGVGGGITGYGAQLMMIDDPIKSREQAESASYRDKVWHWFNDDMMTRLDPDGQVILIQTRWHEDDLAGRLLRQQQEEGGEEWHVIRLPAICEDPTGTQASRLHSGSPPYEGGVDAASADGVVLSATPKPDRPVKPMPARHIAFTTMPPYRSGKNYGDILREREEAKRAETLNAENAGNAEAQKHLPADADQKTSDIPGSASSATSAFNIPVDPLNRRPGEALWPARYDIKALERTRKRIGTYSFEALYQQRPVPTEGGLFKRSWFTIVQVPPPNLNWKRGYDLSFAANPDSDPSATLKVAYDKDGVLYIDGCFTGKLNYPLQRKMLMHYIRTETRTEHGIELSANGHALLQDLRQMPQLFGRKFRGVKVETSKLTRALPWIALAEERRIRLVAGRWNEDFINEACSFPHGQHDDQIDAVSIAVSMCRTREKTLWVF